MDFPPRLRLLHWDLYSGKRFSRSFYPEYLVELNLPGNQLEMLWQGKQPLGNLKMMNLILSSNLKELPDLSNATNLEGLNLIACESLVEIPPSTGNLQKLKRLLMGSCIKLQVVPTLFNLAFLEDFCLLGCSQLRKFPDISTNITSLSIMDTMLDELPESVRLSSRLWKLGIYGSAYSSHFIEKFPEQSGADIEKLPDWIKDLHGLEHLLIIGCPKLASLPELPSSLREVAAFDCESLETQISFPLDSPIQYLQFPNCFKLDREAQRAITQQYGCVRACLPGKHIPAEFDHRATGNSLIIRSDFYGFRICVVVSPKQQMVKTVSHLSCHIRVTGRPIDKNINVNVPYIRGEEHLFVIAYEDGWLEQDKEILFEFSTPSQEVEILECGVQILMEKSISSRSSCGSCESMSEQLSEGSDEHLCNGCYESCSELLCQEDHESFFDGSNEFDEYIVKLLKT